LTEVIQDCFSAPKASLLSPESIVTRFPEISLSDLVRFLQNKTGSEYLF
jgi:hypothetical protein